jgi:hypothetical protein
MAISNLSIQNVYLRVDKQRPIVSVSTPHLVFSQSFVSLSLLFDEVWVRIPIKYDALSTRLSLIFPSKTDPSLITSRLAYRFLRDIYWTHSSNCSRNFTMTSYRTLKLQDWWEVTWDQFVTTTRGVTRGIGSLLLTVGYWLDCQIQLLACH